MNKTKIAIGLSAVVGLVAPFLSHASELSTTTLATSIGTMNATIYDYFSVLLTNYWPLVVGFGVLVLVWGFGRRILHAFN